MNKLKTGISNRIIFIDESGDVTLPKKKDAKDTYVICSVFIVEEHYDRIKRLADLIIKKHAGTGELKSSTIGNNTERRKNILRDIFQLEIMCYCLIIEKDSIWNDTGLSYKKSFYKFCHKLLYDTIRQTNISFQVVIDYFGSTEFMNGFTRYIDDQSYLFEQTRYAASDKEPLIQIADVIAGTVRRYCMDKEDSSVHQTGGESLIVDYWPPSNSTLNLVHTDLKDNTDFDVIVRDYCLTQAKSFIEENIDSKDLTTVVAVQTVLYMLREYYINPNKCIYKRSIAEYLHNKGYRRFNERKLFSKLRDEGLIISSTENGVKIPSGTEDIKNWISRVDSQITPYLRRVDQARKQLLLTSNCKYDIVPLDTHNVLHKALKSLSDRQ